MIKTIYQCDACGATAEATDQQYRLWPARWLRLVLGVRTQEQERAMLDGTFDSGVLGRADTYHVCGWACAARALRRNADDMDRSEDPLP